MTCPIVRPNEHIIDRIIRVVIGSASLVYGIFWAAGALQIVSQILGVILTATGIIGYCGIYQLLHFSTLSSKKAFVHPHRVALYFLIGAFTFFALGSLLSVNITKKIFLEDYNRVNGYYKQTLFLTGQGKREDAKRNYTLLLASYRAFKAKYTHYRPFVFRNDSMFSEDLNRVDETLSGIGSAMISGDMQNVHTTLEAVRPIFQAMFKRNGFSQLAIILVDFHDAMETLIEAADQKDGNRIIAAYPQANQLLLEIENMDSSEEIQSIRRKLQELYTVAKSGENDALSAKAAELKTSFVKVYLRKG